MKTLYILRHAKSSWVDFSQDDFDRTLDARGEHDLPLMGAELKKLGVNPDYIISSSALRAITTAKGLANSLGFDASKIDLQPNTYESSAEEMLKSIKTVPDSVDQLMIVGHNPSVSYLVSDLANDWLNKFSTCGCYAIQFENDSWKEIVNGTKKFWVYPKLFSWSI